jgi:hypothetical protein
MMENAEMSSPSGEEGEAAEVAGFIAKTFEILKVGCALNIE